MQIREMVPADWPDVCRIYVDGMNTDLATFETAPPDWTNWDAGHISKPRLIAEDEGKIIGFAVLSPASKRACYVGVAEVSVYVDPAVKAEGDWTRADAHAHRACRTGWILDTSIVDIP